jgi:hypothetical protein
MKSMESMVEILLWHKYFLFETIFFFLKTTIILFYLLVTINLCK